MSFSEREQKHDSLVRLILCEYIKQGYFAIANYGHSEGADITVVSATDGRITAVCECKNYAKFTRYGKAEFVANETFNQDVDKLNQFDTLPNVEKWFIVSYSQILTYEQKEKLRLNNIRLREMGYEPST
jgi:hypothetical protein